MVKKRRKLTNAQTKKAMPAIKEFNSLAKVFLRLLGTKIRHKEENVARIAVMVSDMAKAPSQHNISIRTIDINKTTINKKGSYSFNKKMEWEQDIRSKNKGLIL
ncbi:MAG: hypothetical protein GY730_04255 [bacterium]|nr:hypothetical protein [bacterium]